jgi:hypothetical protein
MLPVHERVQAAQFRDLDSAGALREVIGVCDQQLQANGLEVVRRERLDRRLGGDRHESRCFNVAMSRVDDARAAAGTRIACCDVK